MTRRRLALVAAAATALLLAGCTVEETTVEIPLPPEGAGFDYQLSGPYAVPAGATVVTRDSTASPAGAGYDICYVNGFQTQPGDAEFWLTEHPGLLLKDAKQRPIFDPKWPDEYILDTSSALYRSTIFSILAERIQACADAGYHAIEIDNLDTYTRYPDDLTVDDNIALAAAYADFAHRLGLAIGQKNAAEDSLRLRDEAGFDFAIAEQCGEFDECALYIEAYGQRVYDIEYKEDAFPAACEALGNAILRDKNLLTPDDEKYVYQACA